MSLHHPSCPGRHTDVPTPCLCQRPHRTLAADLADLRDALAALGLVLRGMAADLWPVLVGVVGALLVSEWWLA